MRLLVALLQNERILDLYHEATLASLPKKKKSGATTEHYPHYLRRSAEGNSSHHLHTHQMRHIVHTLLDQCHQINRIKSVSGVESCTTIHVRTSRYNLFQAIRSYFAYSGLNERYSDFNYSKYCSITEDKFDTMAVVNHSGVVRLRMLSEALNIEFRLFEPETHQHRKNHLTPARLNNRVIYHGLNHDTKAIVYLAHMLQANTHGLNSFDHFEPLIIAPKPDVQQRIDRFNFGLTNEFQRCEPQTAYSGASSTATASDLDTTSLASHSLFAAPSVAEASTHSLDNRAASSLTASIGAASAQLTTTHQRRKYGKQKKVPKTVRELSQTRRTGRHISTSNPFNTLMSSSECDSDSNEATL